MIILIVMLMSILLDEVTAIQIALWFGIPGLAALGYSFWAQQEGKPAESPNPPVT